MKGGQKMEMYQCASGSCGYGSRSFLTRAEKVEMLQEYKKDLEQETQAVQERIEELESQSDK